MIKPLILFIIGIGIGNGIFSYTNDCDRQYLNLRKPINYIVFPHTIGFYIGRAIGHDYGESTTFKTRCDSIFNETLKGPLND